MERIHFTR